MGKCQLKPKDISHTHIRMAKIKIATTPNGGKDAKKLGHSHTAEGNSNDIVTLKSSVAVS